MKPKLSVITVGLIFCISIGFGQNESKIKIQKSELPQSFVKRAEYKVAYTGSIVWLNGINLGSEYLWKEYLKSKKRRRGGRMNKHQFLLNANLGFSTNFSSKTDTGIYTNAGLIWRRTNKKGKQFNIEFNPLGYYRSFLPETFEVNGDNVEKVALAGRGYYTPSISVGIGKERKGKVRSGSYFNVNYTLRTSYNGGNLPAWYLQYGFRFNFNNKKK
ncbi:hypothetical protein [uncultured Croceitalea sp.]|uniref:hypothetical protein n=1 Tax=uncultured Croceitalea sp. TaxID=1798908 RepID=UPI0033057CB1